MFCPECGKELPDDSVFCEFCGARIDEEETVQPQPAPQPQPRPEPVQQPEPAHRENTGDGGSNNRLMPIIGGVALVAVLGVALFLWMGKQGGKDPGDTAEPVQQTQVEQEQKKEPEAETAKAETETAQAETKAEAETAPAETTESEQESLDEAKTEEAPVAEEPISKEPTSKAELTDFGWVGLELPEGTTKFSDLERASGKWKCLIHALTSKETPGRIMLSVADIQYHGNIVTIYMDVTDRFEYTYDDPTNYQVVETPEGAVMQLSGKWDESAGTIDATSVTTSLRILLTDFGEKDGYEYAIGEAFAGEVSLGGIYLVRP